MLIKRTEREKHRGSFAAFASGSNKNLDRRAFLRRSGLAASGLAALGAMPLTSVRKAKAGPPPAPAQRSPSTRTSVRTALLVARLLRKYPMAYGSARSRVGTARSIEARIVPRALRFASWCTASGG